MIVFAENFRGFKNIEVDTTKVIFLLGDNSSGKSSILYLIDAIFKNELISPPRLDEDFGVDRFDYFSPYFNNANVTFGFINRDSDGNEIAKIITVKKSDEQPTVLKCSYWVKGMFLTIKKTKNGAEVRIIEGITDFVPKHAIKVHKSAGNFKKIVDFKPETISEIGAFFACTDITEERYKPLIKGVLGLDIEECTLVSPIRAMPERFYPFRRRMDSRGSHFATMMMDIRDVSDEAFELIDKFGCEAKLFDKLDVKKTTDEIDNPPLIVTIEKNGKSFLMNQVGIGVSQIVPVLIDAFFSVRIKNNILLTMQPELHLHPVAQAAFGTYLHSMAEFGLSGVFETHSSFLIDRFRSEMNASDSIVDAEIIFCLNGKDGNRTFHIPIEKEGNIKNEPASYHQFFVDELVRTIF
jgi:AAA ATPase domain